MKDYSLTWRMIRASSGDQLAELAHDLLNAVVTLAVLFGTIAWVVWAAFPKPV